MDFLADCWEYFSCYETNRNFVFWSAISTIQGLVHRKVYYLLGDVEIFPMDYILMVSPQGAIKKTTICGRMKDLFIEAAPDLPIAASNQTVEDIVRNMSKDDMLRVFTNERGESIEVKALRLFINEFKNFISYNPLRMLNFMTDVYDQKVYDSGTIKRGGEVIINPCISMLGCENQDQLIKFMKADIVSGGFSRRVIVVYEDTAHKFIPSPVITAEARIAWDRVRQRAKDCRKVVGVFKYTPSGQKFFNDWYIKKQKTLATITNPMMRGYMGTKDVHLLKTCMALDVVSDNPMLLLTEELLQLGIALLDSIETNMPKLYIASGRNEMAGPMQKILDIMEDHKGVLPEKKLKQLIESELNPMETFSVLKHLEETDRFYKKLLKIPNGKGTSVERWMFILPERWEEGLKNGEWKVK